MANSFLEAVQKGKRYVPPEGKKNAPAQPPQELGDTIKKISETSLERMTGPIGQVEETPPPRNPSKG